MEDITYTAAHQDLIINTKRGNYKGAVNQLNALTALLEKKSTTPFSYHSRTPRSRFTGNNVVLFRVQEISRRRVYRRVLGIANVTCV